MRNNGESVIVGGGVYEWISVYEWIRKGNVYEVNPYNWVTENFVLKKKVKSNKLPIIN